MIKIKNNFDLKSTITCGQIFRFEELDDGFIVILDDRVIKLKEDKKYIYIESSNYDNLEEIINDYFDLNRDYEKIINDISKLDKKIEPALIYSKGLKMIHQSPLITIIEYIISQNNRVPSIKKALDLISEKYGDKIEFDDKDYYLFPSIDKLSKLSVEDFRECKVGFRDKYLYEIVKSIKENKLNIDSIYEMNSDEALKYLMSFKGIGNKVASCILLFAYQKFDVYPIDTWVKKFMLDEYGIQGEDKIREYTKKTYQNYSGLAIQYMFNYKRNGK